MNRSNFDRLIIHLLAIANFAKDIHYNCIGDNFYENHLLADRFADNIYKYIDQVKEVCLIGHQLKPKKSSEYLTEAAKIIPLVIGFRQMRELMLNTLNVIESIVNISKGDENVLGEIAQDIQNNVGLLNIMFGDFE